VSPVYGWVAGPDLLIGLAEKCGEQFSVWQIAYAEILVTETLWPDFNRARLLEAFVEFQRRERRYGGIREGIRIRNSCARAGK